MLNSEIQRTNSERGPVSLRSHLRQIVCASQVRGGTSGQLLSISNRANTRTISEGISQRGSSEVVYRAVPFSPKDTYYWVLPESFLGDKVRGTQQSREQSRG